MVLLDNQCIALLGKSRDLAWAEINAVYPQVVRLSEQFVLLPNGCDPHRIVARLGGTVKVVQVISQVDTVETIPETIYQTLAADEQNFALSSAGLHISLDDVGADSKRLAKRDERKLRYRILESVYESAGITTDWVEFVIFTIDTHIMIGKTVAVQDLAAWTKRDYGRPKIDPRSGMMPPKIARMLVNLAYPGQLAGNIHFYDPFCGSGTLLVEALDLGMSVVGSDLSEKAVSDSQKNCEWFGGNFTVFQADATHVTLPMVTTIMDGIAFEGYLGPPNPQESTFPNLVRGLSKLYKGVFKTMYPLLKPDGRLVCALPFYKGQQRDYTLDKLIDDVSAVGYTRLYSCEYSRPQAVVGRKIYVLKKI